MSAQTLRASLGPNAAAFARQTPSSKEAIEDARSCLPPNPRSSSPSPEDVRHPETRFHTGSGYPLTRFPCQNQLLCRPHSFFYPWAQRRRSVCPRKILSGKKPPVAEALRLSSIPEVDSFFQPRRDVLHVARPPARNHLPPPTERSLSASKRRTLSRRRASGTDDARVCEPIPRFPPPTQVDVGDSPDPVSAHSTRLFP